MPLAPAVAENRSLFRVVTSASYRYTPAAYQVVTYLRLAPPDVRGLQTVREHKPYVAPLPYATTEYADEWGNRVAEVRNEMVAEHLTLVVELTVETACRYSEAGAVVPTPLPSRNPDQEALLFCEFTRRTTPVESLAAVARTFDTGERDSDPFGFVARVRERVHREMTFASGTTQVGTTAGEAWASRRGVCQDYTHIMLVLCRLLAVPARYVSGFVPGEGVMHAWVEVLLPAPGGVAWFAVDPTYNKWVTERYIAVAVGRDYGDATPTSGTYYGGTSHLRYSTRVETTHKELVLL